MPTSTSHDATSSVRIPLQGKHGQGYFVTVDAIDWPHVQETWGEAWTRSPTGHVVYGGPAKGAKRLARLLLGAKANHTVLYRDDDPTNLRRANLTLVRTEPKAARLARVEGVARALLGAPRIGTAVGPIDFLR